MPVQQAITQSQARKTLKATPQLADATMAAIVTSQLPAKYKQLGIQCAAQLYHSGWMHCKRPVCNGSDGATPPTGWAMEVIVDDSTHAAVKQLRAVGILPAGWLAWSLALVLRWAIEAFLKEMIRNWLTDDAAARATPPLDVANE